MLYGAMFDEVNEGTAMFKMLPNKKEAPVQGVPPENSFVTLDADGCHLPSDWYMRLAGTATAAFAAPPVPLWSYRCRCRTSFSTQPPSTGLKVRLWPVEGCKNGCQC